MTIFFLFILLLSFLVSAFLYHILIPKYGSTIQQPLKDSGPTWHAIKSGTPTFGGIIFILVPFLFMGITTWFVRDLISIPTFALVSIAIFLFGCIGFLDDYIKVHLKNNKGLSPVYKLILQTLVSTAFVLVYRLFILNSTEIILPLFHLSINLGFFTYFIEIIMIVGFVNGVNITDGIDGLAGSISLIILLFFGYIALTFRNDLVLFITCAIAGSILGFLMFNHFPAKIFMGDTGSEFLGGVLSILAIITNCHLILFFVGITFVFEILSDILQVSYKKINHGKKLFKMAPFHHSLELSGWKENKIVLVFDAITLFFSILFALLITLI